MKQDHIQNGVLPRYFPSEQLTLCAQTDVHFKLLYFSLQKKNVFYKTDITRRCLIFMNPYIDSFFLKFSRQKILEQVFLTPFLWESLKNQFKSLFLRARTP